MPLEHLGVAVAETPATTATASADMDGMTRPSVTELMEADMRLDPARAAGRTHPADLLERRPFPSEHGRAGRPAGGELGAKTPDQRR